VSSIEVEDCVYSCDGVAECAVIGVPDEKWGETIKAIVVCTPDVSLTQEQVIAHCKSRMAGYKAPTTVDFVEAIPRTATGKVQKFKLRDEFWTGRDRQVN
jgi:acyl-CoA synthetase (AMP-forming)/AMP-acid ligase II